MKFYDFDATTLSGKKASLKEYQGKVALVVNTASKCGLTPQYAGLQKVFEEYQDRGFTVLGFPSNDFAAQEPGTADEIAEFCEVNYGVDFPLFAKGPVTGDSIQPVYRYLTQEAAPEGPEGEISWNFEKFLVDREGNVRYRFSPRTSPEDPDVIGKVRALLTEGQQKVETFE